MIESATHRWLIIGGLALYGLLAFVTVDIDPARIAEGLSRASAFFAGWLRPDFVTRWTDIRAGLLESLAMTAVATAVALLLSIPLGLAAARNLVPGPVYTAARGVLAVSRSFHEILVAILFVAMFGFGPFAGVVTLVVGSVGFLGKLLAEAVEEVDPAPPRRLPRQEHPGGLASCSACFPKSCRVCWASHSTGWTSTSGSLP
tara:strand:- start:673 stop:1278 length:606 start_codon:yes stop_codon:yes gene_type:complete